MDLTNAKKAYQKKIIFNLVYLLNFKFFEDRLKSVWLKLIRPALFNQASRVELIKANIFR
jgi:hypothetical protein